MRSFLVGKENSNDIPGFLCLSSIVFALERQKFDSFAVEEDATCRDKMQVWPHTACNVYSTCYSQKIWHNKKEFEISRLTSDF